MQNFLARVSCLVIFVAVGSTAAKNPSPIGAGCVFTMAVGTILFATVGSIARQGDERLPYLGYAVFAAGYLALAFATGTMPKAPVLPTALVLNILANHIEPRGHPFTDRILNGIGIDGVPQERLWFLQIGHSLLAILIGLFGSLLARVFRVKSTA